MQRNNSDGHLSGPLERIVIEGASVQITRGSQHTMELDLDTGSRAASLKPLRGNTWATGWHGNAWPGQLLLGQAGKSSRQGRLQ